MLCYIVFCCILLYFVVLYSVVLCIVLFFSDLFCVSLCRVVSCCVTICCVVLYYIVLYCIVVCYDTLCYVVLYHNGWSRAGVHYGAVFACYMIKKINLNKDGEEEKVDVPKLSLLASSPMNALPSKNAEGEDEESVEAVNFKAEVLVNFLNQTLKDYGYDEAKNFATCQVADSASSNIRAAMLMGIPHLDCNNHTLNLEVKKYD